MKRLILMRHAKSSWSAPGRPDIDRPLNRRGRQSAVQIGNWLKGHDYLPDHALISISARTRETWAGMEGTLGMRPATAVSELYEADPTTMLGVLRKAPDVRAILVLGHQPGIGAFARKLLADPPENDPDFDKYPTATTAIIDFDVEDWREVGFGTGRMVDFVVPKALA